MTIVSFGTSHSRSCDRSKDVKMEVNRREKPFVLVCVQVHMCVGVCRHV